MNVDELAKASTAARISFGMGVQDIVALTIVAGALVYAGRGLWRTMAGRGDCACPGQKSCPSARKSSAKKPVPVSPALKRLPLVSLQQVRRPVIAPPVTGHLVADRSEAGGSP